MQLLATYGKRTPADNVANVAPVSETRVKYLAKLIDLRSGDEVGNVKTIDLAHARDGRVLRNVGGALHVVHPDGRSVPVQLDDAGVHGPTFVGKTLVVQDDRQMKKPFGVFDCESGALRGRLEHTTDPVTGLLRPFVLDENDGRHVWTSDVTSVRRWDVDSVACVERIPVPEGHFCYGVALLPSGNVVTSIRPHGGTKKDATLVVLARDGSVVARRHLPHMGFLGVGDAIVATDDANKQFVVLDERLEERETAPMPPKESYAQLVPLWSGLREFVAVDGHNQFHHYGDASLKPSNGASADASKPAAKKPAKKGAKK